jgi:hypothetical protein
LSQKAYQESLALMFVFWGGLLTDAEIAQIRLAPQELVDFGFFTQSTLPDAMTETLRQRVLAAWRQVTREGALYLEEQKGKNEMS